MSIEIIPAIDIMHGKCVRLTQGDYSRQKIYNEHPLEVALQFEDAGLKRLHLVDLDGAKEGRVKNWNVLEIIAGKTNLIIDFGGGIGTTKDLQIVFESGASLASIGSIAVKDESLLLEWMHVYGPEKFLLGADVRDEKISISGWQVNTEILIYDFIEKYLKGGIQQIFCTDIFLDGAMMGPSLELYKKILDRFPDLWLIASGGIRSLDDIYHLEETGCKSAIVGKAIYEGLITLKDLSHVN
ncbi:MAG TPA: 1-(5-phosphoribosyl)-5-[(5-phosphoribosylamino)methylideneamino] imidazole-4-carboxamide isomerase [Puia sp.]|jgi:phosphoribosylformimino-5-aminoimidazole carboxamide ribotide isomerase|nr:1-(5-phosphoribosyl)-5-[(5-phosphoribosylamino)methylideneamino] imidazole-4-carboxamide isomerase [Puia sp.]